MFLPYIDVLNVDDDDDSDSDDDGEDYARKNSEGNGFVRSFEIKI